MYCFWTIIIDSNLYIEKRSYSILKKIYFYVLYFSVFNKWMVFCDTKNIAIVISLCPQMSERQMCDPEPFLHLSTHVFYFLACSLVPIRPNNLGCFFCYFLSFLNLLVISFHLWSYFRKNDSVSKFPPHVSMIK